MPNAFFLLCSFAAASSSVTAGGKADDVALKLANIGAELGAVVDDRPAAIVGHLGRRARMVPVQLDVRGADYGEQSFSFEIVRNSPMTPLLAAVSVANALRSNTGYTPESTLDVTGTLRLRDLPDLPPPRDPAAGVRSPPIDRLPAPSSRRPHRRRRPLRTRALRLVWFRWRWS